MFFVYFLHTFDAEQVLDDVVEDGVVVSLEDHLAREDTIIGEDIETVDIDVELLGEHGGNILQHALAVDAFQGEGVDDVALCDDIFLLGLHKRHIPAPALLAEFVVGILRTVEYAVQVALVEGDIAVGYLDEHLFVGLAQMTLTQAVQSQ